MSLTVYGHCFHKKFDERGDDRYYEVCVAKYGFSGGQCDYEVHTYLEGGESHYVTQGDDCPPNYKFATDDGDAYCHNIAPCPEELE